MVLEIFVIARYNLILVLFNVIVTFVHLVLLRNVSNVCVCVCVQTQPEGWKAAGASTPYKRWSKCTMKKIGGKVFAGT